MLGELVAVIYKEFYLFIRNPDCQVAWFPTNKITISQNNESMTMLEWLMRTS